MTLKCPLPIQAGRDAARAGYELTMSDMIDRVRRASPEKIVQEAAFRGRMANSEAGKIRGQTAREADRVLRLAAKAPGSEMGRTLWDLQQREMAQHGRSAQSPFLDLLEGRRAPRNANERALKEAADSFQKKVGQLAEDANLLQENLATGEVQFFESRPNRFPHIPSPIWMDALARGDQALLGAYAQEVASRPANNTTAEHVMHVLMETHKQINSDTVADSSRMAMEQTRQWDDLPAYVRHPGTGQMLEMLETNPFRYFSRYHQSFATHLGFRNAFGQMIDPDSFVAGLRRNLPLDPKVQTRVREMLRSLNGMPVEPRAWTESGTALDEFFRRSGYVSGAMKTSAMTMTAVPNSVEPLGLIQSLAGGDIAMRDFWVALWRTFPGTDRNAATTATLQELGSISLWIQNFSWDPNRPGESGARMYREFVANAFRGFHRYQERLAAAVGQAKVERMMQGHGTAKDVQDAMAMLNVPRDAARAMAEGRGPKELYLAMARRAGAFTTNSPMAASEQARVENSRLWKAAFAFTTYGMMRMRWYGQFMPQYLDTLRRLKQNPQDPRLRQEAVAGLQTLARVQLGSTMAGSAAHFMLSYLLGGLGGLEIAWEEAKDEPWKFLLQSWGYTTFAGPWGAVLRSTQDPNAQWFERVLGMTWPGAIATEVTRYFTGTGQYTDRGWLESTGRLFQRYIPIERALTTQLAVFGLGNRDPDRDAAVNAFRRHYRALTGAGHFRRRLSAAELPEIRERERQMSVFRRHMRKAAEEMGKVEGDPGPHLQAALEVDDVGDIEAVRRSLQARRLLVGDAADPGSELYQALEGRIGTRAMEQVHHHDAVLNAWIERMR